MSYNCLLVFCIMLQFFINEIKIGGTSMFGKWLNTVLNGLKNIHRWEGKQKIGIYDDSYPSVFYRKYIPYINITSYILK